MPIDFACAIILLHSPCKLNPDNLVSDCLILAISYTCFRDTLPMISWPGLMAPRMRFLRGSTFAACRRRYVVVGVRISKVKDRSGRTVTRAGMGTPGLMCAVLALNSYIGARNGLARLSSSTFRSRSVLKQKTDVEERSVPCRNPYS